VRLAFTDQLRLTRNCHRKVYFVGIGVNKNSVSYIKTHNDEKGDPVVLINKSENPEAMASPIDFGSYWVRIKMGTIEVGRGSVGEKVIMEYHDPHPLSGIKYLSVSNWETPLQFKNFIFG